MMSDRQYHKRIRELERELSDLRRTTGELLVSVGWPEQLVYGPGGRVTNPVDRDIARFHHLPARGQ
jgi:hypothetical protein